RPPPARCRPAAPAAPAAGWGSAAPPAPLPPPWDGAAGPRPPTATTVDGGRTARPYSALFVGESTACHDVPPSDVSSTTPCPPVIHPRVADANATAQKSSRRPASAAVHSAPPFCVRRMTPPAPAAPACRPALAVM